MNVEREHSPVTDEGSAVGDLCRGIALFLWCLVRLPLLILLSFLEPFVRFVLVGTALLTVITALVFEGSSAPSVIPFWGMLCIAVGCISIVPAYHGVLRFLSR